MLFAARTFFKADDGDNSIYSFLRFDAEGEKCHAIVSNFTPVERTAYRLGLPRSGEWKEVLNTAAECYAGGGRGNCGRVVATEELAANSRPSGCEMVVPPLSTVILSKCYSLVLFEGAKSV